MDDLKEIALQCMKGHQCRGFSILSEAWYGKVANMRPPDVVDEMSIGIYGNGFDDGTLGEFKVTWMKLAGQLTMRVEAFDDSWRVMPLFFDLFTRCEELNFSGWSDGGDSPTSLQFGETLKAMGYVDITKREQRGDISAPNLRSMKLRALKPQRVAEPFVGILKDRPPIVVGFMGGRDFDEGCVTDEVKDFVETNCKGRYVIDPNDIFFEDEGDAMLVSMRFA